jgi:hypothetical protein
MATYYYQLLLLMQGRYVKPDEYAKLSEAIPGTSPPRLPIPDLRSRYSSDVLSTLPHHLPSGPHIRHPGANMRDNSILTSTGTTTGSIRNRISALRVQQRDLYESLGWDVPEGGAGHSAKKPGSAKPGPKRKNDGTDSMPGTPTPAKKGAGLFAGKKRAATEDSEGEGEGGSVQGTPTPKGKKVKVEVEEDDEI